jgi:outer membrane protein, heavy metal efflux system
MKRVFTSLALFGVALGGAGWSVPARAAEPPAPIVGPAPADDFRRSDPQEAELAPVAESSGLGELTAAQPRGELLTLAEVLDSLIAHDPRLVAARRQIEAADGRSLAARGGFDPRASVRGFIQPFGYYRYGMLDARIEQPTPAWGLSVWAGWRLGLGDFAIYDTKSLTASGGEVYAGVTLPLWQGGPIDRTRADIRQAQIGEQRAGLELDARQLELELVAATAYWNWVEAGLALEIERSLLALALERDAGLRRMIELGSTEAIVGTDNRRLILDREARVVGAERGFQAAALELSLVYRDESGAPILAGADRLPRSFPSPKSPMTVDIEGEIASAIDRRPDLAATRAQREQAEVELRLAKNQRSPEINLSAWVAKDVGTGPEYLLPLEAAGAIEIEIPIPMRRARGQLQAARADVGRIDAELRFARERIAVDIRDAHSEVAAAFQRARLANEQVDLAHTLARAEMRRLELGAGDLLLVNLRELAATTAEREELQALAAFFIAEARLDVALGQPVQVVQAP